MPYDDHETDPGLLGTGGSPLVSVVIAVYDGMSHIEDACISALNQTYPSLEVIVVDDGSTDETNRIVATLAASDPRVRLIRQQNRGVASARNAGIAAASGEFVAPLDADDVWEKTKLERQVRRLQECGSETGLVYCWWAWIDVNGIVLDRSPRWQIEGHVLNKLIEVNFTGGASVPLYRRVGIEEVGGYSMDLRERGSQGCEDWDLALRIAERYGVAVVPAVLVGYRRRGDSMSAGCDTMWRSQMQVLSSLATRQPEISPAVLRRASGQFALYLAGVSFWSGNYLQACRWALRARSFALWRAVFPHVARMLARRWLGTEPRQARTSLQNPRFDESDLPEPLMPYDRIYERHWDGQGE